MSKIIDLMLMIRESTMIFYHKDTNCFDYCPVSEIEFKKLSPNERLSDIDTNNFRFLSYEEIDHKEIMSFFVREYVTEKVYRKQLFDVLRRKDYIDTFLDKLHELNLYDDFIDTCGEIYIQSFMEWADKNGLDFKNR